MSCHQGLDSSEGPWKLADRRLFSLPAFCDAATCLACRHALRCSRRAAGSLPAPKLIEHKDIDVAHADNPQYCVPYVHDIYAHLRETEKVRRPNMRYLEDGTQSDINSQMRSILVDWLVEVAEEYKLVSDTLYLSVNYIDRVLSSMPVQRSRLQLVGVSCMLVAAKYEEIYAPQVDEFVYITDNTYTRNEVIQMERKILDLLGFELTAPTGKHFLRRFIQSSEPDGKTELLANYLCELTLVEAKFLQYLPSKVAAACVFLANFTMKRQPWNSTIEHYTGYTLGEIAPVVAELHKLYKDSPKSNLVAIREKYAATKFKSVSTIVPPEHLHGVSSGQRVTRLRRALYKLLVLC